MSRWVLSKIVCLYACCDTNVFFNNNKKVGVFFEFSQIILLRMAPRHWPLNSVDMKVLSGRLPGPILGSGISLPPAPTTGVLLSGRKGEDNGPKSMSTPTMIQVSTGSSGNRLEEANSKRS